MIGRGVACHMQVQQQVQPIWIMFGEPTITQMHVGSHDCQYHTTCGPQLSVLIWARYLNFRGDPDVKFPPILKIWWNVCYDLALMRFAMPYLSHMCQLNTTYGPKVDAIRESFWGPRIG